MVPLAHAPWYSTAIDGTPSMKLLDIAGQSTYLCPSHAAKRGWTNVISVSQLTKVFGQTLAVDRISFDVPEGQVVGFLGPNGAGKSTTLRILTCYLPATSGTATIAGFDIFHESEAVRQKLGYLPENCPLYPEMK